MNIENLVHKIKIFEELIISSGFKRDIKDYQQSISQPQNHNLVFMKDLSRQIIEKLQWFEDNDLNAELEYVLKENEPIPISEISDKLRVLNSDVEIDAPQYFKRFNQLLTTTFTAISSNQSELDTLRSVIEKYVSSTDDYESDSDKGVMALVFKDLESTGSLKEFAKVIHRWNTTLIIYHTLLKSDSPQEISLLEIQNGSIDVIFNIDVDIAIDLVDLIKTGLKVYAAYLLYKSKTAKEIISSYMGNRKLISSEKEREKLMLENIKEAIKQKALEQHKKNLKNTNSPEKTGATKKADEVAKVITDHIIKGNEVKLLAAPQATKDESDELSNELRHETSIVRERWKKLSEKEKQMLLDKFVIKDKDD